METYRTKGQLNPPLPLSQSAPGLVPQKQTLIYSTRDWSSFAQLPLTNHYFNDLITLFILFVVSLLCLCWLYLVFTFSFHFFLAVKSGKTRVKLWCVLWRTCVMLEVIMCFKSAEFVNFIAYFTYVGRCQLQDLVCLRFWCNDVFLDYLTDYMGLPMWLRKH